MEVSASRRRANRRNALKSAGPKSPNGKAAGRQKVKSEKQSQICLGMKGLSVWLLAFGGRRGLLRFGRAQRLRPYKTVVQPGLRRRRHHECAGARSPQSLSRAKPKGSAHLACARRRLWPPLRVFAGRGPTRFKLVGTSSGISRVVSGAYRDAPLGWMTLVRLVGADVPIGLFFAAPLLQNGAAGRIRRTAPTTNEPVCQLGRRESVDSCTRPSAGVGSSSPRKGQRRHWRTSRRGTRAGTIITGSGEGLGIGSALTTNCVRMGAASS